MNKNVKDIALLAAEAAEDKKAININILEVKGLTVIADYFVICSGNSETQVQAIADGIKDDLGEKDIYPQNVTGTQESHWILLDYADVIVHVFHKQERDYYEIERLWADAKEIKRKKQST
ncbi:MAG: ribosome silencing factor [Halanaerobiaceae bacterium]